MAFGKLKTILMCNFAPGYSFQDAFVEISQFGEIELISCGQTMARVWLTPNGAKVPTIYEPDGNDLLRADKKKEHTLAFLEGFGWKCDTWTQAIRLYGYKKEE